VRSWISIKHRINKGRMIILRVKNYQLHLKMMVKQILFTWPSNWIVMRIQIFEIMKIKKKKRRILLMISIATYPNCLLMRSLSHQQVVLKTRLLLMLRKLSLEKTRQITSLCPPRPKTVAYIVSRKFHRSQPCKYK